MLNPCEQERHHLSHQQIRVKLRVCVCGNHGGRKTAAASIRCFAKPEGETLSSPLEVRAEDSYERGPEPPSRTPQLPASRFSCTPALFMKVRGSGGTLPHFLLGFFTNFGSRFGSFASLPDCVPTSKNTR